MVQENFRVLVPQPIHENAIKLLKEAGEVVVPASLDEDAIAEAAADVDGAILRTVSFPARVIEAAPRVKVLARHGVGVDNIDLDVASKRGIYVVYTPEANAQSVCEHTFMLMLALAKQLRKAEGFARSDNFNGRLQVKGVELSRRTLGIVGVGRIGTKVAAVASAFGMRVFAFDPFVTPERAKEMGVTKVEDLKALLADADFVTLHTPLMPETHHMIGAAEFAAMKPTAYFINASRGPVADEAALLKVLKAGKIAGAGLDVFEEEPPQYPYELLTLENVVVTPHTAAHTEEALERMAVTAAEEVLAVLRGQKPRYVFNAKLLEKYGKL